MAAFNLPTFPLSPLGHTSKEFSIKLRICHYRNAYNSQAVTLRRSRYAVEILSFEVPFPLHAAFCVICPRAYKFPEERQKLQARAKSSSPLHVSEISILIS
jgi:hypothetical protein